MTDKPEDIQRAIDDAPTYACSDAEIAIYYMENHKTILRALEHYKGWRPIETMPKGERVLVYARWEGEVSGDVERFEVHIAEDQYIEGGDYYASYHRDATHWMPLPQPPEVDDDR